MCGIVGTLSFSSGRVADPDRVTAMRDALAHRGPDAAGLLVDGAVGLGHRRLSIVDVSGGHQPMTNEDRSVWVVFNGEIYNHQALRAGLIARGHDYRTRSDTETIVHLYEERGIAGLDELEGMFAFALWDRAAERLVLMRDRLGIKPLYYSLRPQEIVFASEIKALVAGGMRVEFNREVLPEYLANRYVAGYQFFTGVRKLLPGHRLIVTPRGSTKVERYWSVPPPAAASAASRHEETERFAGHLRDAVERHLMSDVPLGVFLSGGIDSSALAAVTSTLVDGPLKTFAVGFDEPEGNELPYAAEVARFIGSEHHEVRVTADEFFAELPRLVWGQDEPMAFSSGVPLALVSRRASEHVKVVLTGEGADELLLGYNRYRVTRWNHRLGEWYSAIVPAMLRAGVRRTMRLAPRSIRRIGDRSFLARPPGTRSLVFDNFAVFHERLLREVVDRELAGARDPYWFGIRCYADAIGGTLDRMSATDLQTYLCELLMKQDRMSMAASIESRVPFLDDRLVSYVASLPACFKLRGWTTKAVLRDAVRSMLPSSILTRRKMGFPVPLDRWFRGSHSHVIDELVTSPRALERNLFDAEGLERLVHEHRTGTANHGERLWLLVTLEIWQRLFCDREPSAAIADALRRKQGELHAHSVAQGGRPLAPEHGWTAADRPDSLGALSAAPGDGVHHPSSG